MNAKKLAIVSVALAGVLAAATVEARGRDDVQFSVTISSPGWSHPTPVYGAPVYGPQIVGWSHDHGYLYPYRGYGHSYYGERTRWDRDGDGVPNRYEHRYTPRWDRDGDGIPNRYDRHPNRPSGYEGRGYSRW